MTRRRTVESAHDIDTREVLACDESFFGALLAADHDRLRAILADDFVIIDVLSGQIARREELLGAISSGELRFAEVTRYAEDRSVRLRDSAAVVAERTRMVLCYQGDEVTVHSRYTHVHARDNGRWRLMSAQGTLRTTGTKPSAYRRYAGRGWLVGCPGARLPGVMRMDAAYYEDLAGRLYAPADRPG
jgi:ketosteroid isomerase-like protein